MSYPAMHVFVSETNIVPVEESDSEGETTKSDDKPKEVDVNETADDKNGDYIYHLVTVLMKMHKMCQLSLSVDLLRFCADHIWITLDVGIF